MAGVVISLDSRAAERGLGSFLAAVNDLEPLMATMGEIAVSQAQDSFENQAGPDGTPWEPSQRAMREGGQTLVDSEMLLASLSNEIETLPQEVVVGSSRAYAAIHQLGGKAGRGHAVELPARPFLPDDETIDMEEIDAAIEGHFGGLLQ